MNKSELVEIVSERGKMTKKKAEDVLTQYKLAFVRTKNVNMGKAFFYNTDESFIVKVPAGEERHWVDVLQKEPDVFDLGAHYDEKVVTLD